MLTAAEVVEAVKARIGKTYSRDQGELELRFSRPWTPTPVPDEEFSFRVSDPPATGLSPSMQFRFEVVLNDEVLGSWQTGMDAKLWRDVWICRQPLRRGAPLRETDISIERRDVLRQSRDLLPANLGSLDSWEVAETLNPGQPLLNRSLAPRVVVSRGQTVDALFRDGTMTVSVKAETLENGAPGQLIRIRNLSSRRELRGRVINEQTVHIQL